MAVGTVEDLFTEVRRLLQDTITGSYRYENDSLLACLNRALLDMRRIRPDLFNGTNATTVPSYSAVDSTAIDIDQQYRTALIYFVLAYAHEEDEEEANDARSDKYMQKAVAKLLTVAA